MSKLNAAEIEKQIRKATKSTTFEPDHRYWLDLGSPEINAVLGTAELGIPYGKIIELRGVNHGGKTTLSTLISGIAQKDGAGVGMIDLEDSRDSTWSSRLGVDYDQVVKIYPKMIKQKGKDDDGGKKPPRLQAAEELFEEFETALDIVATAGFKKQFWFLDSVAHIQAQDAIEAGARNQDMRTRLSRAILLSDTLPRWAGLAANYNAMIILINQVREKQGVVFGDRTYSPGGNEMQHCCAVRATVSRIKSGKLKVSGGGVVGIVGKVRNFKNKAGQGSVQDMECGFRIRWDKQPAVAQFISIDDADEMMGKK